MTVSEYLQKKRQENPDFATLSDFSLYKKLQVDGDQNLSNLQLGGASPKGTPRKGQKSYERKVSPDSVNAFFDWTDLGINDQSGEWAKAAYNNSITGLAYQMYNGEQRFNLDGYNPGMVSDIFSSVLSFMMPMDFATMFAGGVIGKGMSSLAGYGMRTAATENLVKLGAKKGIQETTEQIAARKILAKQAANEMIEEGGYSALLRSFSPKVAGAIGQSSVLATFEGVRGGMSAAVNDEDIWEGIGHGVKHGGIMGGISGAVGASLNVTNAKLWNKAKKGPLTPKEARQASFWRTGKGGQVLAEAGVFTAPEVKNIIMDEDYSMRDLAKSFFTNAGMMGVLKLQHKGQSYLWGEGKKAVKEYWDGEGKQKTFEKEKFNEALEAVEENTGMDLGSTKSQEKSLKEISKEVGRMEDASLKAAGKEKKDSLEWQKDFNKAERDLAKMDVQNKDGVEVDILRKKSDGSYEVVGKETIYHDPSFKVSTEGIVNAANVINSAYGAMKRRIKRYKQDNPDINQAREAKLKEYQDLADAWLDMKNKTQDIEAVRRENKKMSLRDRNIAESKAKQSFSEAWEQASESQRKNLRQGLEDKISEKGEIKDASDFQTIQDRADVLLQLKKGEAPPDVKPKNKIEANKKQFEKEFDDNINVDSLTDIAAENAKKKSEKARGKADKLLEVDKNMQNEKYGDTPEVKSAYETSKKVVGYIHRQIFRKGGLSGASTELNKLVKFAKNMADGGKSLFEISNKDILNFINKHNPKQETLVKLVKGLRQIRRTSEVTDSQLFKFSKKFELLKSEDIVADVKDLMGKLKEGGGEGLQLPEISTSGFNVGQGQISLPTKKGSKVKYVTQKLQDMLTGLIQIAKGKSSQPGHDKYLIRNLDGTALTTKEITELTIEFFGKKKFEDLSYGEARLFRNAIEQWAVSKKKINSPELKKLIKDNVIEVKDISDIVDKIIVGHGTRESMKETYAFAKDVPTTKKVVKAILKEYAADIGNKKLKTTTSGKGYAIQEIRAGLQKLKNHKGDITYKDRNGNTRTIDKATVEAMFQYMLESGPRLNEIAPDSQTLGFSEKYASKEKAKTDYQLLSEAKSAESLVKASELVDQVRWVKKKFPALHVAIKKTLGKHRGEYVLGKIQGHLIKIAKNKARIDTLPHEVSHHVVDVLKAMGDPFSKKLVKDGIKMFKGEEAFVEALGKYVSKQLPKSKMGRMRSWVARTWNHFKQYFGLTNRRDVAQMQKELVSIIGGKVIGGKIPTDVMPLKSRIKVKYQTSNTKVGKKFVDKARKEVENIEEQLLGKDFKYTKEELKEIGQDIIGDRQWDKLDVFSIEKYKERLNILAGNTVQGKSKKLSINESKVLDIETRYDVSKEKRDTFFKEAFNTTIDKANDLQLKSYNSYIIKGNEIKPRTETAADSVALLTEGKNMPSIGMFKRAFMTAADVIYHYGGKPGRIISKKLLAHDYTRSILKGEGEVVVERIKKIVNNRDVRNNYMHMLDGDLARGALKDIKKLHENFSKNNPNEKNPWTAELNKTIDAISNFSKGGKYYEARELWQGISNFYWKSLIKEISLNTRGNKEFQRIKETLDKKYINQYFARKVTRDALQHINKESPQIQRLIEENIKKLTKKDLEKAITTLNITKKKNPVEYAEIMRREGNMLKDLVAEEIMGMIEYGTHKVRPAFLKERGAQLPEYIEVNVNGAKKLIKTYETSLDGTIASYVNGMAKYISTVKHFPEFTELKGKFSLGGDAKIKLLDVMSKSDTMGAYAAETIKSQLALDFSNRDILMNPALEKAGQLTNISAVMGLSSPMAGIKNVMIQIPRSAAIYGARNTVRAMSYAVKTMRDPRLFEKAMKRGEIGYGTRELLRKESPGIKWWFDNINLMTKTENFNRIVLAEAGRMHFADLTNVARGSKSMFHPQGKKSEVIRMYKETWKLSDADVKFITEGKNIFGSARYEKILQRVGFESHKAGAGATGTADLPLWMANKYIKPLTLFQRMATSVTIDSYKNYVKPLKNGNIAPLLKAAIGHGLTGASLFWFYDKFMGQQIPEEESPAIDRAISYLWKGEFLGMFGEIISPYEKGMSNPIMEPVLLRNAKAAWSEVSQVIGYGKGFDQALKDFGLKSIVVMGQLERGFNNLNHPYVTNTKRIKTLRRKFNEKMGYDKVNSANFLSQRQPYYYKLKQAILFGKSDKEIARAYYSAYNYIVTDYENQGIKSKSLREKKAKESIDAVIRYMHPINLPDDTKGRYDSKRNEFLNYLSKGNKELALKLEKEWKYKERAFYRIIRNSKWKREWSVYTY